MRNLLQIQQRKMSSNKGRAFIYLKVKNGAETPLDIIPREP